MVRRFALAASALTGVPLLVAWLISQRMLHPNPKVEDHDLSDFDLPAEEISFPSRDGTRLAGWFIPAGTTASSPGIVLSHGWRRSRAELLPHADLLHRAGFAVLAFDYRHRGQSGGNAVTMGLREQDDLLGALDTLAARPEVNAARIGVLGMSLGAVMAILVAARDERVRAVVAECPFTTGDAMMTRGIRHYTHLPSFPVAPLVKWIVERRLGGSLDGVHALAAAGALSPRPVFLIADERDAVIGAEETQRVFEAAGEPKRYWFVSGADHACGWQAAPEEYERRVVAFLRDALGASEETTARGKRTGR
jgi:dienelactone hydrolase